MQRNISSHPLYEWKVMCSIRIGDRATSDVVVRLRTPEGRDNWVYCHSEILIEKSKYFADRLSENWPTCQILDSRNCVEVYCQELEFNSHVSLLRLLYLPEPHTWYGVRNTLGILQVAVNLGCHQMARACLDYLEAVPWEEAEEEEILRMVPTLGSQYEVILARLQPVDPMAITGIFISAFRFATSSPPCHLRELKTSVQEQLEYMLTEDDDIPLLSLRDAVLKSEVRNCVKDLLSRLDCVILSLSSMLQELLSLLSDIAWVCQILCKMEMMKDLVHYWVSASDNIVKALDCLNSDGNVLDSRLKVVEVTCKVLEAISSGNVILPTSSRIHVVNAWLPFARRTRLLVEPSAPVLDYDEDSPVDPDCEIGSPVKMDAEIWQVMESAFVSIVLTLPSEVQAEILAEWLKSEAARYPDLTEAFEVWCYRSKIAYRRCVFLKGRNT
ncbi:BTB/POZ domain-containing protein At3g05675 isoform X2 [Dioscorea cayenensis subsp. rotundata]|uniref:BTB/POZ domain-containing protein At3g05675 isoform X2 n=1 Tax=Dioscorea cayennensis subsp. rotundata TaxID=55577 RepID=A0AB40CJX5_DIOCR|nr:BTB/POZ domain-containing protein At3g05675 isoform X2 [Dioscorea cayenensis subsp. rotundata]